MGEAKDGNYPKTISSLVKAAHLMDSEPAKLNVIFEGIAGLIIVIYVIGAGVEAAIIVVASLFNKELTPFIGGETLVKMFFGFIISFFCCMIFCTLIRGLVKTHDQQDKKSIGVDE